MPYPREDLDPVPLDLHPPPPAVAQLPAPELSVHETPVYPEARGEPLQDADQPLAVRLARRQKT